MCLLICIEPMADSVCASFRGIFDLIATWTISKYNASCVSGDCTRDGELDGCSFFVYGIKLKVVRTELLSQRIG